MISVIQLKNPELLQTFEFMSFLIVRGLKEIREDFEHLNYTIRRTTHNYIC